MEVDEGEVFSYASVIPAWPEKSMDVNYLCTILDVLAF